MGKVQHENISYADETLIYQELIHAGPVKGDISSASTTKNIFRIEIAKRKVVTAPFMRTHPAYYNKLSAYVYQKQVWEEERRRACLRHLNQSARGIPKLHLRDFDVELRDSASDDLEGLKKNFKFNWLGMNGQPVVQYVTIFIPTFETSVHLHQLYKWNKKPALNVLNELKHIHPDLIHYEWFTTVCAGVVTCSVVMVWGPTALRAQASAQTNRDAKHFAAELLVHFLSCEGWLPFKLIPQPEQTFAEFKYDSQICKILERTDVKEITKLYQIQQKRGRPLPHFEAFQSQCPRTRDEKFIVNVKCEGYSTLGFGESKKIAKERAAAEMNKLVQSFMAFHC